MRKIIGFIIVFLLMITLIPVQQAEASTGNHTVKVSTTLNVREKPSPKAKVVGSLKNGTVVNVYSTAPGGWSKIKYKNKAGYVASSYLKSNTVSKSKWSGKWKNQFGSISISNENSTSFKFDISVAMGGHVGDINGTAKIIDGKGVYTEYIESFEGYVNDPTCRITFTKLGKSIAAKETGACVYYHGMAATFDGTYSK